MFLSMDGGIVSVEIGQLSGVIYLPAPNFHELLNEDLCAVSEKVLALRRWAARVDYARAAGTADDEIAAIAAIEAEAHLAAEIFASALAKISMWPVLHPIGGQP